MPATLTYPGVYIQELPSGVRPITGVATSIAAFIGRAKRGPVNEPITINSFGDFERAFGGLWTGSSLGYGVRDFYVNGGATGIIVRLFKPTFANDAARKVKLDEATPIAQAAADAVAAAATTAVAVAAATATTVAKAARDAVAAASAPGAAAAAAASSVAQAAETRANVAGATAAQVSDAATAAKPRAVSDAANAAAPAAKAELTRDALTLTAKYEGAWGNELRVRVDYKVSPDVAVSLGLQAGDLFNLQVYDGSTGALETYLNVSTKKSVRRIDELLKSQSRLVQIKGDLPEAGIARPQNHTDPDPGKDVWDKNQNVTSTPVSTPASDGNAIDSDSFIGAGLQGSKQGLYALAKADLFNILCIPPYKADDSVDDGVSMQAAAYCEVRRAMYLVDPPPAWTDKASAVSGVDGVRNTVGASRKNCALYFPRLREPDPLRGNLLREFVPSGAVAGIFARTDTQRGVWKAPAGLEASFSGVPYLTVNLNDPENGELNPLGVNCLRSMPVAGNVVWGSRTLDGADQLASDHKYVPVRRLTLFIEETLFRGTKWVVFEPNDEPLWAQIRLNVGAFMNGLFRQRAFQGATPRDAYLVKCDSETTTQNDINRGVVNILVGFAPLKPAEFVVITIQQLAGQVQT